MRNDTKQPKQVDVVAVRFADAESWMREHYKEACRFCGFLSPTQPQYSYYAEPPEGDAAVVFVHCAKCTNILYLSGPPVLTA